jgi:hypothetical protein
VHTALDITDTVSVEVGVSDQGQWCTVADEVDTRFEAVDNSGDEFLVQQVGYAGIGRLLDQLLAAIDQVDADARDSVQEALEWAHQITDAFAGAADFEAAEEALAPIFEGEAPPRQFAEATTWILDTCGVDIDG